MRSIISCGVTIGFWLLNGSCSVLVQSALFGKLASAAKPSTISRAQYRSAFLAAATIAAGGHNPVSTLDAQYIEKSAWTLLRKQSDIELSELTQWVISRRAVPGTSTLYERRGFNLRGIWSPPEKPAARSLNMLAAEVAELSEAHSRLNNSHSRFKRSKNIRSAASAPR